MIYTVYPIEPVATNSTNHHDLSDSKLYFFSPPHLPQGKQAFQ